MGVFKATRPGGVFDNIETEHDCLADLAEALRAGPVLGSVLETRRGVGPGERIVTGRRGIIMTGASFTTIEDAPVRFVEFEAG